MTTNAVGSPSNLTGSSSVTGNNSLNRFDPSKMMDMMIQRFMKKTDKDGDGQLSAQELSGLSSDAFKSLDTDGDGKLSSDEIKSALQKAMDEMKQAASSSDPTSAMQTLKNSPEGQLLQAMRPGRHRHGNQQQGEGQSATSQVNINMTIYNISATITQTQGSSGSMDVTA